jgi:tetratricopeptide (TPR) repeat protein
MKSAIFLLGLLGISLVTSAQERRSVDPIPPNQPQAPTKESINAMNADLVTARTAVEEHRYTDAKSLMLKDSVLMPHASLIWLELGFAQLGLKEYEEAGGAFQKALGIDSGTHTEIHREDYYSPADVGVTHASRNLVEHTMVTPAVLAPEIAGAAYSSLGEVYARTGKIADAQSAWETAARLDPAHAALHLGNAAIIFNQVGASEAQVTAANEAIAVDPKRAILYYFKGQGLASKARVDDVTQKMVLPAVGSHG